LATGNYLKLRGSAYLVTNCHVVKEAVGWHLAHLPGPSDEYVACTNAIITDDWPIDVAMMRLTVPPQGENRDVLSPQRLAPFYSPGANELLFWMGFPGSKAERREPVTGLNIRHTWFGELETPAIPFLTQEFPATTPYQRHFDPDKHVLLHFPSKAMQTPEEPLRVMPNPKGMSGSLLWDTKFVASLSSGNTWSPNKAEVCGLLWAAHDKPEVAVATKIEHIRASLLHFLREEAAYFHWIDRGRPCWDPLTDWIWAERDITDLS
jgi:hypothetical protein